MKWIWICLLGWLLPAVAVADTMPNPLSSGGSWNSGYSDFAGSYSSGNLKISLQLRQAGAYSGQISFNGQNYTVQANAQGNGLQGHFWSGSQAFPLSASLEGNSLLLETGGTRYSLPKEMSAMPPPSFSAPAPSAPASAPFNPATAGFPQPPPNMLPAPLEANALLLEYSGLTYQIKSEFQSFLVGMKRWLSDSLSDEQAALLVEQQLLPDAQSLSQKMARLDKILTQMSVTVQMNSKENQVMQQFSNLSAKGGEFFSSWQELLSEMIRLSRTSDKTALQTMVSSRFPPALKNTLLLARNFSQLAELVEQIPSLKTARANQENSLNPSKLLKMETMRNMSEMMREGMDMFNERAPSSGATRR